jgi:tetratricopeptide (TPR) repeat protein
MKSKKITEIEEFIKNKSKKIVQILSAKELRNKIEIEQFDALIEASVEKAQLLLQERKYKEAEIVLEQALRVKDDCKVKQYLVIVKMYLGKMPEAKNLSLDNIKKYHLAEDFNNLSLVERSLRNHKEAYKAGLKAYKMKPKMPSIVINLAITAAANNKYEIAEKLINKAIKLSPNNPMFYANKATVLCENNKFKQAEKYYKKSLSLNPKEHQVYIDYFYCLANQKKYKMAWPLYENRYSKIKELSENIQKLKKPVMYFKKDFYNEKICIIPEQGFGDVMMFLRFLPEFQKIAPNSYFYCTDTVYQFAKNLPIRITNQFEPDSEYVLSIMSLPYHLGINDIPPPITAVNHSPIKTNKLKVGICWAGSAYHPMDWNRSTYLKWWESFLEDDDLEIYSFMKDRRPRIYSSTGEEVDYSEGFDNYKIIDLSKNLTNAMATALELNKVDVLVTVDTFVAHVAATCGVPVELIVGDRADWRWGQEESISDWYSTVNIHRKEKKKYFKKAIESAYKKIKSRL